MGCVVLYFNLVKTMCSLCCSMMKYDPSRGEEGDQQESECIQWNKDAQSIDYHGKTLDIVLNIASVFGIFDTRMEH